MSSYARATLKRIEPYVPGRSAEDLQAERGLSDIIKLASNENPLGPAPKALQAIAGAAGQVHIYPDGDSRALREAIAARNEVEAEQTIFGCGSDEVIRMIAEAYLDPGDPVVMAQTTFSQYAFVARLMAAREVTVPLIDGFHDLEGMARAAREHRAKLCFVCNPNNPTGTYVDERAVQRFLDEIPDETLAVFDEAYIEYVDAPDFPDVLPAVREGRRVIVMRTFSKIYGLAGLRVGYGIAPREIVADLEQVRAPFNINRIAQAAALASLDDADHLEASRRMNTKERERLTATFRRMGYEVYPSQANFIFVSFGENAGTIYEALLNEGIIVRNAAGFGRPDALRISVGTADQNDRLLEAMAAIGPALSMKGESQ